MWIAIMRVGVKQHAEMKQWLISSVPDDCTGLSQLLIGDFDGAKDLDCGALFAVVGR